MKVSDCRNLLTPFTYVKILFPEILGLIYIGQSDWKILESVLTPGPQHGS